VRGVLESRLQIIHFQIRHLFEYLFRAQSRSKQVKYVYDSDAHAADTGSSPALLWIDGDAIH
jgi:hypothetical protein